jgi:hypothetical protein
VRDRESKRGRQRVRVSERESGWLGKPEDSSYICTRWRVDGVEGLRVNRYAERERG